MAEVNPVAGTKRVSEAISRPARTAAQAAPSWIVVEMVDAWLYDMNERQFGASVLMLTLVFGWIQNYLENRRGRGYFLRDVPPSDATVSGS